MTGTGNAAARVTISRTDPGDVGQRQVIVAIDGAASTKLEFGETVTIEILQGAEPHRLSISNPDFCCSAPVCALVNHARDVVERSMQVKWRQSN